MFVLCWKSRKRQRETVHITRKSIAHLHSKMNTQEGERKRKLILGSYFFNISNNNGSVAYFWSIPFISYTYLTHKIMFENENMMTCDGNSSNTKNSNSRSIVILYVCVFVWCTAKRKWRKERARQKQFQNFQAYNTKYLWRNFQNESPHQLSYQICNIQFNLTNFVLRNVREWDW